MKLFVESVLDADPATVWEVFESEAYRQRLDAEAQIQQQILEERTEPDGIVFRRVRTEPDRELPKVVAKLLGAPKLCYLQENRLDLDQNKMTWQVTLDLDSLADRVEVSGTTTCTALPDGRCRRVVDGDIEVRVRLVGGQIERAVVAEFERSMQRAVALAEQMLRERDGA